MRWGAAWIWAGLLILAILAGCGRGWIEERAPWRHDAEVECLKSGAIKPSAAIAPLAAIAGPGMCGADFPLKVSAIGDGPRPIGFADDPRPPASIPARDVPFASVPSGASTERSSIAPGAPMPIGPPIAGSPGEPSGSFPHSPLYGTQPPPAPVPSGIVPLGPKRDMPVGLTAAVVPPATLACPMVSALGSFVDQAVQPAAWRWFGQAVVEIRQISAYSCRPMNGQRGAPISEHAFGNALDIAGFTLADGRRVSVRDGWRGPPEERGFLHDIHTAACAQFATVLAPGSNAFHYDHIHVDLARHASGRSICEPDPIPGDLVAGRSDSLITGSTARRSSSERAGRGNDVTVSRSDDARLPHAIPGAD